jgi:hypothetical protein
MIAITLTLSVVAILTVAPFAEAASAPWLSVEQYYLRLLNCSRTGGWVNADGSCKGYGSGRYGRKTHTLTRHSGISANVARPYARLLARLGACSHFKDGSPGTRLRRAGYRSYRWAENLGCGAGQTDPYKSVLGSHRYFQSEKNWDPVGGHYRNMMNPKYTTVGIGVWKDGSRVRLVTDFYAP